MRTLTCLPLLLANLCAQDDATTVARLCDRSDAVAIVRPLSTGEVADGVRTVRFSVLRALSGTLPPALALGEPAERACGRALAGVAAGAGYVAFLRVRAGSWQLTATTPRAMPQLEPLLLAHVSALLADSGPRARRAELVRSLASGNERVRDDAAHALAALPGLEAATTGERESCAAALAAGLPREDAPAVSLLTVASRLRLVEAIERVVLLLVRGELVRTADAAARCIAGVDSDAAAAALGAHLPGDPLGRGRALRVLDHLACAPARASLEAIARAGDEGQVCHAARLMFRIGMRETDVAASAGIAIAEQAAREHAQRPLDARPRYRFVHPESRHPESHR